MSSAIKRASATASRAGRAASAFVLQRGQKRARDRALYSSFSGRFSDSPRAIYEELLLREANLSHTWVAEPPLDDFPGGVRTVRQAGVGFLREAGRSSHLIANHQMSGRLHKPKSMVYLQTWHGTPLKMIGSDNPQWRNNPSGLREAARDYAKWDYLVTQNSFSSEIFRRAFGFDGTILETGYPRNDALLAPDRDQVRQRVRERLGVESGRSLVLYAPTWRDDLIEEDGKAGFSLALDLTRLGEELSETSVFAMRLHYMVARKLGERGFEGVLDVSSHPDIRELYLAADVLITDYSSAMFDFAVTGKPIIFFTPDLEAYRDRLRGFYFELEDEAPGPLCRTTDETLSVLRDLAQVNRDCRSAYSRFTNKFCPHDDGQAAKRVVDEVFGALSASEPDPPPSSAT